MESLAPANSPSAYRELGIAPVVNACGIYTEWGGSVMSPTVRTAATEANATWASITDLLDRSGEAIAEMLGVEAVRVVPGASAGLALSVSACMTGHDGRLMEQLPNTSEVPRDQLLMQVGHRYIYTRCALMSGAALTEVGDSTGTSEEAFRAALTQDVACVLHPAHLDAQNGTLSLDRVVELAHDAGIPVVVDAAYMSFPTDLLAQFARAGADATCFSAKYFWGPNAGGFVYGRKDLIATIAELDFTCFESGPHQIFGRAFKMDRSAIVATVLALREWLAMDHDSRWAGYQRRAIRLADSLADGLPVSVDVGFLTLDERLVSDPVNSVFVRPSPGSGHSATSLQAALAEGTPTVRTVTVGDTLVLCLETVGEHEDEVLTRRLQDVLRAEE